MQNEEKIVDVMTRDHENLMQKLNDLESIHDEDVSTIIQSFRNFKWHLEKHFFVEERAIFTFYNPEKIDESYDVFSFLTKEHTKILEQIDILQKQLQKWEPFDFKTLKKQLRVHKNFEENNIYPVLDKEISEGEKRFIIERINEII